MKFSSRNNSNYTPKYIKFPIDKSPFNIYRKWTTERTCSHSLNRLPIFAFLSRVFLFFSVFFLFFAHRYSECHTSFIYGFFSLHNSYSSHILSHSLSQKSMLEHITETETDTKDTIAYVFCQKKKHVSKPTPVTLILQSNLITCTMQHNNNFVKRAMIYQFCFVCERVQSGYILSLAHAWNIKNLEWDRHEREKK